MDAEPIALETGAQYYVEAMVSSLAELGINPRGPAETIAGLRKAGFANDLIAAHLPEVLAALKIAALPPLSGGGDALIPLALDLHNKLNEGRTPADTGFVLLTFKLDHKTQMITSVSLISDASMDTVTVLLKEQVRQIENGNVPWRTVEKN